MNTTKNFLRGTFFLIILIVIFSYVSEVFARKWDVQKYVDNFYEQPTDSIDVLFLGASGFGTGVSPLILWEEAGFTSFSRAIGAQQASMTYYYFLESLKYQHPDVVVLDAYRLIRHNSFEDLEVSYRRSYEPLKMSIIKLKSLFDITSDSDLDTFISFLFPFFRYHTRWPELERADFEFNNYDNDYSFLGQFPYFNVNPVEIPEDLMAPTDDEVKIYDNELYYFEEMIRICREKNIKVFLLVMPRLSLAKYSEYNAVKKFADKHDLLFIDYNFPELMKEVDFNPATDMLDQSHVNPCGAVKFSRHLAEVLKNNFSLPDRRNDPDYERWHLDLESLKKLISQNCYQ